MASTSKSWLARPHLLRKLLAQARLAVRLFREPAVSALAKLIPVLGALYLVDPLDFVPDVLPIIGQVDDLAVAIAALEMFLKLAPSAARAFHEAAVADSRPYSPMPAAGASAGQGRADSGQRGGGDVIDAEWRRD